MLSRQTSRWLDCCVKLWYNTIIIRIKQHITYDVNTNGFIDRLVQRIARIQDCFLYRHIKEMDNYFLILATA